MASNKNVISIPLSNSYRMIVIDRGGELKEIATLSHESYNIKIRTYCRKNW